MCEYIFVSHIYFYMVSTNWLISFIKAIVDGTNLERWQTRNFPPRSNFQWEAGAILNI